MFNEKQEKNFNKRWDEIRIDINKKDEKPLTERELRKLEKKARRESYSNAFDEMFDNIMDKINRW